MQTGKLGFIGSKPLYFIFNNCNGFTMGARSVNPDATEIWYDGVDQDCSGGSDHDQDGDGFDRLASGGTDCKPATGFLCLESEGSPIEFRGLKIRELP